MSNWNSFFDHKQCGQPHTQPPKCFPSLRGTPSPVPRILLILLVSSGLSFLAEFHGQSFNHDLSSTQDYGALLTHRICSLIPSFVLTKAWFVLVCISTSEPSLANSDNLAFHRFFFPYDLPSFPSLKSQKKRYPSILSKDNLSGYFFSIFSRS